MEKQTLKFKKLDARATPPTYGSAFSAGADLYACMDEAVTIAPGQAQFIHTGLAMEIPVGYAGLVYARSGVATKKGIAPANKVGVVDSDYRGELMVCLYNQSSEAYTVSPGERIAQIVITPVLAVEFVEAEELSDTARGAGGFGSTGKR